MEFYVYNMIMFILQLWTSDAQTDDQQEDNWCKAHSFVDVIHLSDLHMLTSDKTILYVFRTCIHLLC